MVLVVDEFARQRPDEVALSDSRAALTWSEVNGTLERAVHVLLGLDLGPDRRVAILAENALEGAVAHAAALLAGVSAVPVNFHLKPAEVAYILDVSGARVLLAGPETVGVAREAAAAATVGATVVAWRSAPEPGVSSWEALLAGAPTGPPPTDMPPLPPLMFTSGTTGRPKAVEQPPTMFPGGSTVADLMQQLRENPLAPLGPHLVVGPMYHTGPLTGVRTLLAGAPVVVAGRFDAESVLRTVQEHRIATTVMVPTHFSRLLALPEQIRAQYDVSSLAQVLHTGAACPVRVKRAMIDWWGPVLVEAYGATEVGTTNSIDSHEWLAHPGSVGRAVPPFEAVVVDGSGNPVPAGLPGQLCFRDANGHGLRYLSGDPSGNLVGPDLFTLGEVGYLDDEGYVYITDRSSDLVVSGGVNLYPAEAEAVLAAHPGVADVAAFGVPDEEMGEQLRAVVVVSDPSLTEQDLKDHCRSELSHFKCPRSIQIVGELPRSAMGKLDKRTLRATFGGGVATSAT